jgi:hypothetical protein
VAETFLYRRNANYEPRKNNQSTRPTEKKQPISKAHDKETTNQQKPRETLKTCLQPSISAAAVLCSFV